MAFNRKQRLRDNIEAIRTAFALDKEGRQPMARERLLLERYCGFGGLKCILNPARELADAMRWPKSDLELFATTVELHKLVRENSKDEAEYKRYVDAMKQSVLTAFYTPQEITSTIADALHDYKVRPDRVLEPSAGVGAFIDAVLEDNPKADVMAFEKDLMTGKILKYLYPDQKVRVQGFEKIEKPFKDYFDLAISNIPFGDVAVFDPEFSGSDDVARRSASKAIHNYFFMKSLDCVKDGGIVAFITSQGVLNSRNSDIRASLVMRADLISAVRLPNNLFTDNANTEVGSDLVILRRHDGKKEITEDEIHFCVSEADGKTGLVSNNYFKQHHDRIIHTKEKLDTDPYGKPAMVYLHDGGVSGIAEDLRRVLGEDFKKSLSIKEQTEVQATQTNKDAAAPVESEKIQVEDVAVSNAISQPAPSESITPAMEENPSIPKGETVQLTLFDLWDIENTAVTKKQKPASKGKKQKVKPTLQKTVQSGNVTKPKAKVVEPQPVARNGAETANASEKTHPGDIYSGINWEDNPPINGFYEMMMDASGVACQGRAT